MRVYARVGVCVCVCMFVSVGGSKKESERAVLQGERERTSCDAWMVTPRRYTQHACVRVECVCSTKRARER